MMRFSIIYPPIFAGFLVLAGCAGPEVEHAGPVAASATRACHERIELAGRFSVRYQQDGQEQGVHGNFQWAQDGRRTEVTLLSPLGQTMATIELTPQVAKLVMAGKAPRFAADADTLAADALGWPLPVSGLRGWLQGCVLTADGRRFVPAPGRERVGSGDGWQLHYPSWVPVGDGVRPKRIDLERRGATGEVSLRLVIDDWRPDGQ